MKRESTGSPIAVGIGYGAWMSDDILALLESSLRLPATARALLASKLLESIADESIDEKAEAEWEAEIERRVADVESGRVQGVPWSTVHSNLEAMISKRRGR